VGAHYDTVRNCPGADDNGSGVAGVLEIARVLVDHRPERTVRMCFFAAEEVGLVGSRAHVERILADSSRRVDGLLDLEMIGYRVHEQGSQDAPVRIPLIASIPQQGDFILVAGNFQSGGLGNIFEGCVDRYVPGLKYFSANRIAGFFGDAARSDHYPYWQAGLRGIMLTDTANFRNPHYHRRTDTIDTIDFEFLCAVSRATAAALIEWGGRVPGAPEVVRTGRIEGDSGGKFALDRANGAKTPNRVRLPARSGVDPEWSFWDRDLRDSAVFPDVGTTPGLRSTDSTGGSDAFLFLDARACHGSPAAGPGGRAGSAAETRSDSQADPR